MANILITGAGGFTGRNLAEHLSARHCVYAMIRKDLDLLDEQKVRQFFAEKPVDIVIHAAVMDLSRVEASSSVDLVEKNLRMFFNLARCIGPDQKFIQLGSGAEYDRRNYRHKMSEEFFDTYVPADGYGYAKYIISKYIESQPNMTCLRIFGLFGKYENYRFKFISNAIVKNLLHMPITISQNVVFDYLYIDDFTAAVEQLLDQEVPFQHMNITPTKSIDLVTLANLINEVSDYQSEIVVLNPGMNTEYTGDNSRLLKVLKGFEFLSYKEAIQRLYLYYKHELSDLDIDFIRQDPYLASCMKNAKR